MYLSEIN